VKACKRYKVTATGITNNGVMLTTTNGNFGDGCTGVTGKCGCIHAEDVLLRRLPQTKMIILSHSPCFDCAYKLWEAGVHTVVYEIDYRKTEGKDFLVEKGINLINIGS